MEIYLLNKCKSSNAEVRFHSLMETFEFDAFEFSYKRMHKIRMHKR